LQADTVSTLTDETRFDRSAWLPLAVSLLLILACFALLAYCFTLPTDGWRSESPNDLTTAGYLYQKNLAGLPSALQEGDLLVAVDGVPVDQLEADSPQAAAWASGNSIPYTVVRAGERLTFNVPITRWTLPAWWRYASGRMANWLVALFVFAIALFTFVKRPRNHAAQSLFLLGSSVFSLSSTSLLPNTVEGVAVSFDPLTVLGITLLVSVCFSLVFPPTLIRFALVFPRPTDRLLRHPRLEYIPYWTGGIVLVCFFAGWLIVGWIWTVLSILASIATLVYKYFKLGDAVSRLQLRWGIGGTAAGLGLFLLDYPVVFGWVTGIPAAILSNLSNLGFPLLGLSLAVAILRYRLFDIDVIIRRTLIYTLLTLLLGSVYFTSIVILQQVLSALTDQPSEVSTVISTLSIAALFNPLRQRVQEFINRRFYRQKYNAEQALAFFTAMARDETDLEALSGRLVNVVAETVEPEQVSLWLRRGEGG
jgi:hypothetical protein